MEAVRKSAVWRRTSGITRAVEATLPEDERRAGLARLVRQAMEVAVAGRENGNGRVLGTGLPVSVRENGAAGPWHPENRIGDLGLGVSAKGGEWECEQPSLRDVGQAGTPALHMNGGVGAARFGDRLPEIEELAAVRGDCDPVGRVCAKLEISQGGLTGLTKEYCGLNTREVCDVARVHRIKPALRERVLRTALACWGRPGLAAEMWCLRGGVLPKDAARVIREAKLMRQRGRTNGLAEAHALAGMKPQKKAQFGPLHDPELPREALIELLTEQLMNAVDEARGAANFNTDAWAVELGFANFSRLKRACIVTFAKAPRQIEWELCRDVVEYWVAVESATLFELAKQETATAMVLRARWLYQGHEQSVAEGAISRLEWKRLADPVWVAEMERALASTNYEGRSTTG